MPTARISHAHLQQRTLCGKAVDPRRRVAGDTVTCPDCLDRLAGKKRQPKRQAVKTFTPTEPWIVPPECGGQIVEVAYSIDAETGVILRRRIDRSDGRTTYEAFRYPVKGEGEWAPQNGAPKLGRRVGYCAVATNPQNHFSSFQGRAADRIES